MKKNKTNLTLATKKSKNIPAHACAAPAVKKETKNSPKEKDQNKVDGKVKRIEKTVRKRFTPSAESKLVMCVFNKRDEGLPVKIEVKNKKGEVKTIEKVYHGSNAAKIVLAKAGFVPEILTGSYCAIKVPINDAQKLVDVLSPYGRVSIPLVFKEGGIKLKNNIPKRKKKPTNNTPEVKITAKKARKLSNLASKANRKTNAEKIKSHALVSKNGDAIRPKKSGIPWSKENPVTWNGHKIKSMRRAKKAVHMLARKEKMEAARVVREQKNIEKKKARIKLAQSKKEQSLNFKEAA